MDKQTLSNYGWIVIVTLILAVMLAFATPFGNYVGKGVAGVTNALIETMGGAVDDDNISNKSQEWEKEFINYKDKGNEDIENAVTKLSTPQLSLSGSILTITPVENANAYCKVKFKVIEGDYLVIMDEHDNITIYITEQYVGQVQVKNKTVQTVIDEYYSTMRGRIDSKREFAREMGSISRRINIPFHIVMAFKGNEELLMQLVRNIEDAISKRRYEDKSFMAALCGNNFASRMKAVETMGITNIPEYQSEKIAKYLHECLEKRKIIRRFE